MPSRIETAAARAADWVRRQPPSHQNTLALAAGALSALSFAPLHLFPLMPLALAALLWLLDTARTTRRAAALGWLFGFGQFAIGLYWIAIAFRYQSNMPPALGLPAVLLLVGGFAIFIALTTAAAHRFWSGRARRALVLALVWVVFEWLRGHLLTGFPWNLAGNAWLPVLPVAQAASLTGVYGLSFLMLLTGGAIAVLADHTQGARRLAGFTAILVIGLGLWGTARLILDRPEADTGVQLHIVQAGIGQDEKWDPAAERRHLWAHLDLTAKAIERHGPGIVIWPETAIQNFIENEPSTRYLMGRHIEPPGVLITGGIRVDYEADGTPVALRNSLFVLSPDGAIQAHYDKAHLVPFGEYMPLRHLLAPLGLDRLAPGDVDFVPGPGVRTLEVPGVPDFGPLICYEVIFPGNVVDRAKRPAWLVNISNDAWFGESSGPYQHLAIARMRAIEEGLPIVRATPTGVSAIIDSEGRLTASLPLGTAGVLTGALPAPHSVTLYARFGDVPLLFGLFLLSFGLVIVRRTA
ncbi:apolipoprotein N-acyltransferase [Pedomonas mirosovicensis]|uniref:apolipoprotein N-acyltransferase n=1 Tax=Pedomonas mirosovicensis TaxID=2908641 RepID=UPI002169F527|nr:apolipoprotein N-acyltransferase [Pedomonas mirosovicensis]MCH8684001.1 apolipoprotein N-acyltransferase [Pedomonas mirosovicensis]